MNAAERLQLREFLHTRCEAIAENWYQAVTSTSFVPFTTTEVQQRLLGLTGQAIEVLLSEPFEDELAQTLGASLAGLCRLCPKALGQTLEELARQLVQGLSDQQVVALQPRLAPLLGGLATGFVRQAGQTVLAEQEQVRRTLTGELQRAQEALRQAYPDVQRQVQERTRELRMSNELLQQEILERRQAEEALARSEEATRAILDASTNDVVALIDADGVFLEANQAAAVRFDKRLDELVGLCVWDLLPPDLAERRKAHAEKVFQSGQLARFEDERAGVWFESVFYPVFDTQGGVTKVAAVARDITERKRMEEELQRLLAETARGQRLLLALSHAAQAVQRAHTREEIYGLIGDEIVRLGYQALVFALSDAGTHLIIAHITYEPELLGAAEQLGGLPAQGYRFPLSAESPFQQILSEGEVVFIEEPVDYIAETLNAPLHPLAGRLAKLLGVEGAVIAPLVVGNEAHGLLAVTGPGLSKDDTQAISAFANQAAIALANVRLYQETQSWAAELERRVAERTRDLATTAAELGTEVVERQQAEGELRRAQEETLRNQRLLLALSQAAQAVQRARTPQDVYQAMGNELGGLGLRAVVFTLTGDRGHLTISHVSIDPVALRKAEQQTGLPTRGFRIPVVLGGLIHRVLTGRESAFAGLTAEHMASRVPQLGRALIDRLVMMLGIERSIYAPLIVSDKPYGLLIVAGTDLSEADIPAITVFANQASIAMDNAYLLEQLDSRQERLRDLAQQIVSAQEGERQRLSRALHDEAGQSLTALKISMELIRGDIPAEHSSLRRRLGDAADLADATMDRLRSLAQDLRPPALDAVGLNHTLEGFCRDFGAHTQLTIHYQGVELPALAAAASICLYRFLQEALTNVVKHASAKQVRVTLRYDAETVNLSVKDDGQGFDPQIRLSTSGEPLGLGLLGMQERLQSLGGRLRIDSSPGQGTRLVAHIPVEEVSFQ